MAGAEPWRAQVATAWRSGPMENPSKSRFGPAGIPHDAGMQKITPAEELQEGYETGPCPPPLIPLRSPPPPRPRLCSAGPCRNYHRLEIQLDAEDPRTQKVGIAAPSGNSLVEATADGALYRPPSVFHTETHHYCYPSSGVEITLGALPVVSCSRWHPLPMAGQPVPLADRREAIHLFSNSPVGLQYRADVIAWEAARAIEAESAREAETLIAESSAAADRAIAAAMANPSPSEDPAP